MRFYKIDFGVAEYKNENLIYYKICGITKRCKV